MNPDHHRIVHGRSSIRARFVPALAFALALAGCGGGGGGGPAPTTSPYPADLNLRGTTLAVVSDFPNAAHEMVLATGIQSNHDVTAVGVTYVLLNRQDVDAQAPEVRQFEVASSVFDVKTGEASYQSVVVIPKDVPKGAYYLISQVDAAEAIPETDEDDNLPRAEPKIEISVDDTYTGNADLVIEKIDTDEDAVVLTPLQQRPAVGTTTDKPDHDFAATLLVSTTGAKDLVDVPIIGSILVGAAEHPIQFWNGDQAAYVGQTEIDVALGNPGTVRLDCLIPATPRAELEAFLKNGGGNRFKVRIGLNRNGSVAEWDFGSRRIANDNITETEIVVVLPPPPPKEARWETDLRTGWRNAIFSVGVDFHGAASLDARGAIGAAEASVPVTLFGNESKVLEFTTEAQVKPRRNLPTESQFDLDLKVLGQSVYSRSSTDPTYEHRDEFKITRTTAVTGRLFAGPIPIQVRAGSTGEIGFTIATSLDPARLEIAAVPHASLRAFAEASVFLLVVTAGVGGELTLLSDEFTVAATASLDQPNPARIVGRLKLDVTNELVGPNGRVFLFADYPVIKWCWGFLPCGIYQKRAETTMVRFRSFRKVDVLYSRELAGILVDL